MLPEQTWIEAPPQFSTPQVPPPAQGVVPSHHSAPLSSVHSCGVRQAPAIVAMLGTMQQMLVPPGQPAGLPQVSMHPGAPLGLQVGPALLKGSTQQVCPLAQFEVTTHDSPPDDALDDVLEDTLDDAPDDVLDDALVAPSLPRPASIPASFATSKSVVPQRTSAAPARNAAAIEPVAKPRSLIDQPPEESAGHALPLGMHCPLQHMSPPLHPLVPVQSGGDPPSDVTTGLHAPVQEQTSTSPHPPHGSDWHAAATVGVVQPKAALQSCARAAPCPWQVCSL